MNQGIKTTNQKAKTTLEKQETHDFQKKMDSKKEKK